MGRTGPIVRLHTTIDLSPIANLSSSVPWTEGGGRLDDERDASGFAVVRSPRPPLVDAESAPWR